MVLGISKRYSYSCHPISANSIQTPLAAMVEYRLLFFFAIGQDLKKCDTLKY